MIYYNVLQTLTSDKHGEAFLSSGTLDLWGRLKILVGYTAGVWKFKGGCGWGYNYCIKMRLFINIYSNVFDIFTIIANNYYNQSLLSYNV